MMRDYRLTRLEKPIEILLPEQRVRITHVDQCILKAVESLLRDEFPEMHRGVCLATVKTSDGRRRRIAMNLLAHDFETCTQECDIKKILLGLMEELTRCRKARTRKPEERAWRSTWPTVRYDLDKLEGRNRWQKI